MSQRIYLDGLAQEVDLLRELLLFLVKSIDELQFEAGADVRQTQFVAQLLDASCLLLFGEMKVKVI